MTTLANTALYDPVFGGVGMVSSVVTDATRSVPATPVKAAEGTTRPWGGVAWGSGAFPGFGIFAPYLSPLYLAQMRRWPAVVLVHARVTEPILAGMRSVVIDDDGGDPDLAERIRKEATYDLLPTLTNALPGALEAPCFGHFLQEVIWSKRDGRTYPADVRSVLPMEGITYVDERRSFVGFSVAGQYRDARYGFLAVNDPHWDNVLGRSCNEAALMSYLRSVKSTENADAIERRASGIQFLFHVMQGVEVTDANGNVIDGLKLCTEYMNAAVQGKSGIVPDMFFSREAIEKTPELAKIPYFRSEQFNWGENGPALMAHLSRLEALSADIYAAWGVPKLAIAERTTGGLGQGSSGDHSDVVLCISEKLHGRFVGQYDAQVSARWVRANYAGTKVRFHIEAAPLADPQQTYRQDVFKARITATAVDPNIDSNVDWRKLAEQTELPLRSIEDAANVLAKSQADAAAKAQQAQQQAVELAKAKGPPADGKPDAESKVDVADKVDAGIGEPK